MGTCETAWLWQNERWADFSVSVFDTGAQACGLHSSLVCSPKQRFNSQQWTTLTFQDRALPLQMLDKTQSPCTPSRWHP